MMEIVLVLSLLAALGYGGYRLTRASLEAARQREGERQNRFQAERVHAWRVAEATRNRQAQYRRLNLKARSLQLALLALSQAPDFRRAASVAALSQEVPLPFRQRQFRRFRPHIVRYFVARLRAGADAAALTQTLAELLGHLGIAPFEAEYLCEEARRQVAAPLPTAQPSFAERLRELQHEHEERLSVLRSLPGLESEMREQLLEAEMTRVRDALLEHGTHSPPLR